MEQNSSLLVREESGPTVTAVYPGARKSEFVATVVHLTTQTVLPDFFGAVLHLQRTDLPIWALQANNLSSQTLCTVDNCSFGTKAGDSGCPAVSIQGGAVCPFSFALLAAKYLFFLGFLGWINHRAQPLTRPAGKSYCTCGHVKSPLQVFCPVPWTKDGYLGQNVFRSPTTHFYVSQQAPQECCSSGTCFCILFWKQSGHCL